MRSMQGETGKVRQAIGTLVGLPIQATRGVHSVVLRLAGPDWGESGFAFLTLLLGPLGLYLARGESLWRKGLAWLACALWIVLAALMAMHLVVWQWAICIPWLLLFFLFLRQGPRFHAVPNDDPEPEWVERSLRVKLERLDYVCLGLIGVLLVAMWLARHTFEPLAPDAYYHLTVARQILEDRAIPLWDTWYYAPEGRPHLYPPLFHILIALLSVPCGGDVVEGFRILKALLLPFSLLTTWYVARWLFDSRRAFFALLIVGTDMSFITPHGYATPSALVNDFVLLLLVMFLSRRYLWCVVLIALGLNTHMGLMPFALAGLLLFALWDRNYLPFWGAIVVVGILPAVPWYAHVWTYKDWLGHPVDHGVLGEVTWLTAPFVKLIWLQALNVILVFLMARAWGMTKWTEKRNAILLAALVAFLPMLFSYGGRYFSHTIQHWSILIGIVFAGLLARVPPARQIVKAIAIAFLCPTLLLLGKAGPHTHPGPMVGVSGWAVIAFTASGGYRLLDDLQAVVGDASVEETLPLATYLRETTDDDQVLQVHDTLNTAVMIGFFADRPIDQAAWREVSRPPGCTAQNSSRSQGKENTAELHIARDTKAVPMDQDVVWCRQGDFLVGTKTAVLPGNMDASADVGTE